jgi:phosphoenolpyruvate carboxykinase (ATP)
VDGFANWDPKNRVKIRVICARAYHALFMRNMLIRPTAAEQASFGKPDFVIYNAGQFPANANVPGVTSDACIAVNFGKNEMVILGSQYAGEMKKGVFTVMHYLAPKKGHLSLHSSANEGRKGDVSLFFGLSGTGKTTLSADPHRALIGDDEHIWTEEGVFNIEGGCYAKCVGLSKQTEPEIFDAIRFGSVLENVIYDPSTREVDYKNISITENTRACYPIEHIANAKIPCVGGHPKNIIFLTCDAFGVLPPVSRLTPEQAMYHFINGYTSKIPGTEVGVTEPQVTFSACFGEAFLVRHPTVYAELLAEKMKAHSANAWLVNTGWTGGGPGVGKRMSLKHTRAILDAIHSTDGKDLTKSPTTTLPIFGLQVPTQCEGVPSEILVPRKAWKDTDAYDRQLQRLGTMFIKQFENYKEQASKAIIEAGPKV